jgi:hypothetical protein
VAALGGLLVCCVRNFDAWLTVLGLLFTWCPMFLPRVPASYGTGSTASYHDNPPSFMCPDQESAVGRILPDLSILAVSRARLVLIDC